MCTSKKRWKGAERSVDIMCLASLHLHPSPQTNPPGAMTGRSVALLLALAVLATALPATHAKKPKYPDLMKAFPDYEEYAHFACEFAEKTEQELGQTLTNMTRVAINKDKELHRRVRVMAEFARPRKGCKVHGTPYIFAACIEGLDPEFWNSDREDYEWKARVNYMCPCKWPEKCATKLVPMDVIQVGD